MSNIIIHFFLFLFIIISNGFIFFRLLFFKTLITNLFEVSILGIMITSFLAQIINFFIPLSDLVIFFNLFSNIIILTIYKKKLFINFDKYTFAILSAMLILCFLQIYGSGFSDDLAHYHGGQITNSDNSKYILGVNFMHHHYGYGSIWLLLHSYLNFNSTFLQDIHIINSITLFLILSYFITELFKIKGKNKNTLYVILSVFVFFFLLKYTRLKEFGLDRPGILFFCFLTYISFKYKEIPSTHRDNFIILTLIISLFLTSIKLFFIFSFLISLFLKFNFKNFKFFLKLEFFLFLFFLLCYFVKNIFWTGCLIYPLYFTCFSDISWNSQDIAYNLFIWTEAHTKGFDSYTGTLSKDEYLANFRWIPTWFTIVSEELLTYLGISVFIIFIITILSKSLRNISKYDFLWEKLFLGTMLLVNLLFFYKAPVIRYHHTLFLFFIIFFFTLVPKKIFIKQTLFYVIIFIFFSFNLGKNFKRIYKDNFFNNPIQHLKKIGWHREPQRKQLNEFTYYNGWIGASPVGNESLDRYKYKKIFFDIIYR